MKIDIKYLVIFISSFVFISCQDVVDVDVPNGQTRLVIEASLDWEKGTIGNNQTIKLSTSTPYFDTTSNTDVIEASVKVTNTDTNQVFVFTDQNNGNYTISNFVPIIDNTYSLEVVYDNETYIGTEVLNAVADVVNVNQSLEGGFNDEIIEINIEYQDPENMDNFYLHKYHRQGDLFPIIEDRFHNYFFIIHKDTLQIQKCCSTLQ